MWSICKTPTPPNWPPPCAPQSVATAAAWRHQGRGRPAARRAAAAGRCQRPPVAAARAPARTRPAAIHPPPAGRAPAAPRTAPDPQYRQLRAVIEQLDGRRAQVLVESLIVEISANKLAQFGVQWQSLLGKKGASLLGAVGTNSGQSGGNITSLTAALASGSTTSIATAANSLGQGMNLLLAPRINGQYYLGALANFLQNSGDANVLSTPNLMTLDNEEA